MPITTCPKCAYLRLPTDVRVHEGVCPSCGIAYQKYLDRQLGAPIVGIAVVEPQAPDPVEPAAFWGRALVWCAFALWTVYFALHGVDWEIIGGSFLHSVILPFHEFGHVFFSPFGRFMAILGGSLFQVLMPLALMLAFFIKQRDRFGASAMLWWSGQSLLDLSPYIADAVARNLPLVGGADEEAHDWGNLLTITGKLHHAVGYSRLAFILGVLVMLAGLAWGARELRGQYRRQAKH